MTTVDDENKPTKAPITSRSWIVLIPTILFVVVAILFYERLQSGDPSKLPSALLDKSVPDFSLPPLEGLKENGKQLPGFSTADLKTGQVAVVNIWASWCVPCRQEHPFLIKLKQQTSVRLFGLNYKDKKANANRFLNQLGNPYDAVGVDPKGRTSIDWGVYGIPETFVVDGEGVIRFKYVGPINQALLDQKIIPTIKDSKG